MTEEEIKSKIKDLKSEKLIESELARNM